MVGLTQVLFYRLSRVLYRVALLGVRFGFNLNLYQERMGVSTKGGP